MVAFLIQNQGDEGREVFIHYSGDNARLFEDDVVRKMISGDGEDAKLMNAMQYSRVYARLTSLDFIRIDHVLHHTSDDANDVVVMSNN